MACLCLFAQALAWAPSPPPSRSRESSQVLESCEPVTHEPPRPGAICLLFSDLFLLFRITTTLETTARSPFHSTRFSDSDESRFAMYFSRRPLTFSALLASHLIAAAALPSRATSQDLQYLEFESCSLARVRSVTVNRCGAGQGTFNDPCVFDYPRLVPPFLSLYPSLIFL